MARPRKTQKKRSKAGRKPAQSKLKPAKPAKPTQPTKTQPVKRDDGSSPQPSTTPAIPNFAVVGVGASAGGLEAFTRLLRKIPKDARLSLVFVLHLSPTYESHLPELLEVAKTLTIVQARDGMLLEPSCVYVIPPDARMSIDDGHLKIGPRPSGRSQYTPIDFLFTSLAEAYGERAIGVVLSGSLADGAAGVREIKGAGGITFAQEPAEAAFDGMPRAAINTGAIDLVLPVEKIADELVRMSRFSFDEMLARPEVVETPPDPLRKIYQLLRKSSGVDFTNYKLATVMRRIQRRMLLHRVTSLDTYVALLQQDRSEIERLYEDILINVTHFFREPEAFDVLAERIFPALLQAHDQDDGPIRMWVPGCSSGEEVYSLAICLLETLGERADASAFQIFGTDVSQRMVDHARAGVYPDNIASQVSPARLLRFFGKVDGQYRINKEVRERCVFARQDVTRDPPFSRLDLILCRNLLIYLGQPLQRRVMTVFHYGLKPHGFLMLGRSESTAAQSDLFTLADKRHRIYRKKMVVLTELGFEPPARFKHEEDAPLRGAARRSRHGQTGDGDLDVSGEANRMILDRYGPPGVIVDRDFRIVRTRGKTSQYLELPPGEAKLDLFKMVRHGLLAGVRTALHDAKSRGVLVRRSGLRLDGKTPMTVNVEVAPMGSPSNRHFLILFEENEGQTQAADKPTKEVKKEKRAQGPNAAVARLEEELIASREYLQSIIQDLEAANEELQSANEEILSSNEELQSTNEELDTAKEELQSTNEELSTVNEELQGRNEELSLVNSDLVNLLGSVNIPIVMVTTDLRIRRFTPAAEAVLNLIPSDVGRPIGHITPNINCSNLESIISRVIETVTLSEVEVLDKSGTSYTLRVRPYKNIDNRIDGAVLTLVSASDAEERAVIATATREWADAVLGSVREPVVLLDNELKVQGMNREFSKKFPVGKDNGRGRSFFELCGGAWDGARLRTLLGETLSRQRRVEGFPFELKIPGGPSYSLVLDAWRGEPGGRPDHAIVLLFVHESGDVR